MKTEIIMGLKLKARRLEFEPEVTTKLLKKGYRIIEVPVSYKGRTKGKKIGMRDGLQAIWTLVRWRI